MLRALIVGCSGTSLTAAEREFFKSARPCGFILFARNLESHAQIRALISDVKSAAGDDDLLVLIDQEGGRVQRLRPPLGRALPPAAVYGILYGSNPKKALASVSLLTRLLASDLRSLGINTDCAPVLDVPVPRSHDIIGNRAYGTTVAPIVALGRAVADGFMAGGVLPVVKHIPGHGRATADSHLELPVVTTARDELARTDFATFKALADLPCAMTAHVVFTAFDSHNPASTSVTVTREVIRGAIGFDGLLMSDDLSMKALSGSIRDRAEAVIRAGSDVALHCNGDLAEMEAAASGVPVLAADAARRLASCQAVFRRADPFDTGAAEAALTEMLGSGAA